MLRTHALAAAALLCAVTLAPSVAAARPPSLRDGASPGLAIGARGNVLALEHFPDVGFDFWFGVRSSDDSAFSLGYLTPDLMIALTLGNIVIGARFEAGFYHLNPDGPFAPDQNVGHVGIVPFFEYWLDGEDMAPFFGLGFGPTILIPDGRNAEVLLQGAGTGGLGFFVAEGFSIGPTLSLGFLYDSQSERAGWTVVLGFDLRGWIGLGGGGGGSASGGDAADDGGAPPPAQQPVFVADPEGGMR
ncbi:MAG: hypothetical protein KC619_17175 [Myxococcales bacterium]|nr:hypothetical protein [Myxococcales bacterium]